MPVIGASTYSAPPLFTNPHIQTIYPSVFRKVAGVRYERETIDTPDGDFLDLDWSSVGSDRMVLVMHGLEGDSQRAYVRGMVRTFNREGWDALALNFRGCGGRVNKTLRFYHSGQTEDLQTVIEHVASTKRYRGISLVGFSLGGNLALKYLGEPEPETHPLVKCGVAISAPCDLKTSGTKISSPGNRIYIKRFLRLLRRKIRMKMEIMPELINDEGYSEIKDFVQFDNRYTSRINGFRDANDYYEQASSKQFLGNVTLPTLLINAADDPFLSPECYPFEEAQASEAFFLERPGHGGHVGFVTFGKGGSYWHESRALEFITQWAR